MFYFLSQGVSLERSLHAGLIFASGSVIAFVTCYVMLLGTTPTNLNKVVETA